MGKHFHLMRQGEPNCVECGRPVTEATDFSIVTSFDTNTEPKRKFKSVEQILEEHYDDANDVTVTQKEGFAKAAHSLNQLYWNKYLELPSMQDEKSNWDGGGGVGGEWCLACEHYATNCLCEVRNKLRQELRDELTKRLKEGQDEL